MKTDGFESFLLVLHYVFDFSRYNIKCSGDTKQNIYVVFRFPLHFMFYRENLDYFLDSVCVLYAPLNHKIREIQHKL